MLALSGRRPGKQYMSGRQPSSPHISRDCFGERKQEICRRLQDCVHLLAEAVKVRVQLHVMLGALHTSAAQLNHRYTPAEMVVSGTVLFATEPESFPAACASAHELGLPVSL
jgi:hypothetical protein